MSGKQPKDFFPFPQELTNEHWQKKKGILAKSVKTGLGEELKKTKSHYEKIDWTKLDVDNNPVKEEKQLEKAILDVKDYYQKNIPPYMKQLSSLVSVAEKTETAMKNEKYKDAATAAAGIAKLAESIRMDLKGMDLDEGVMRARKKMAGLDDRALELLGQAWVKFLTDGKQFLRTDGSAKAWNLLIKQNGRSVSNSVRQLKPLRDKFWARLESFNGFDLTAMKMDGEGAEWNKTRLETGGEATKLVLEISKFKF